MLSPLQKYKHLFLLLSLLFSFYNFSAILPQAILFIAFNGSEEHKYLVIMDIGSKIIYREIVSSTNSVAARLMDTEGLSEGTVIYTSHQTNGRGQGGKEWESEAGMNLCMSIILYPAFILPEHQFQISKIISLALYDFVSLYADNVSIKWSNDLYVKNDKIAGILIEHSLSGN